MISLVCLAGFPEPVVGEIQKRPAARFTDDKTVAPIVRAIRQPYSYRPGMEDFYLEALATHIASVKLTVDVSVVVVYANYGGAGTRRFIESFRPFALCRPVEPFYPDLAPKAERRAALLGHVDEIETAASDVRARARIVRDVLSGQPMSPLLLPLRNFRSGVLEPAVMGLFDGLPGAPDPRADLAAAIQAVAARHPIQRLDGAAFYEDDRALRFKSPGSDRHGAARHVGERHRPQCLIGGRVRLGGPFDALFHYDCQYARGNVDRAYPNCHDAQQAPAKAKYVNIAPSDAIR